MARGWARGWGRGWARGWTRGRAARRRSCLRRRRSTAESISPANYCRCGPLPGSGRPLGPRRATRGRCLLRWARAPPLAGGRAPPAWTGRRSPRRSRGGRRRRGPARSCSRRAAGSRSSSRSSPFAVGTGGAGPSPAGSPGSGAERSSRARRLPSLALDGASPCGGQRPGGTDTTKLSSSSSSSSLSASFANASEHVLS